MSNDAQTHDSGHHVLPLKLYLRVFGALLVLTVLTVAVSYLDLGSLALPAALVLATIKAALVAGFFMHLRYDDRFHTLIFLGSLVFLTIFIFIVIFIDLGTRGRILEQQGNFALYQDQDRQTAADKPITVGAKRLQTGRLKLPPPPEPVPVPRSMRTIVLTPAKIATGKQLYDEDCSLCHGSGGRGRHGFGPRLSSPTYLAAVSDAQLLRSIELGRPGTTMIPWQRNRDKQQIESVAAYVRSLAKVAPAELDEAPLGGDARAGAQLYHRLCSGCHGRTGAGYQETANGTGIGRKAYLDTVTDGFLRHIVGRGKVGTKMRAFGGGQAALIKLDRSQIDHLITHLRDRAW